MLAIPIVGTPPPKGQLSVQQVGDLVFSTNQSVQTEFRNRYPELVNRAIGAIALSHDYLDLFRSRAPNETRSAILELLVHGAINAVLCATHHLISGYAAASGNMLRHYTENVAMTLLCLDPSSGFLEEFTKNSAKYPVHKAPEKLRQRRQRQRLKTLLAFDADAWEEVLELTNLYDALSHASGLSLAHTQLLGTDNQAAIGGTFDPFKKEAYRRDLSRCASAAEALAHLLSVIVETRHPKEVSNREHS